MNNTTDTRLLAPEVPKSALYNDYETGTVLGFMIVGYPALWMSFVGILLLTVS